MAGIVEAQAAGAEAGGKAGELDSLGAGHVRPVAAEPDEMRKAVACGGRLEGYGDVSFRFTGADRDEFRRLPIVVRARHAYLPFLRPGCEKPPAKPALAPDLDQIRKRKDRW